MAFNILRMTTCTTGMHHILSVFNFCFTIVELQLSTVAHHKGVAITQTHVTFELTYVVLLVEVGFISFDLQAGLANHDITGKCCRFSGLLIA